MKRAAVLLLFSSSLAIADLGKVKAEPNAEKRSELALTHAEAEISVAKKAYEDGNFDQFRGALAEVGALADLSIESLDSTGKRARRNPKYFKRAEQRLLVLMRRLDSLEKDVSLEDRATVSDIRKRLAAIQERIVNDIMTQK